MKKRLLSGLIGLLAAQPALSMDLVETYTKAISYDSGIATARATFEAQQAASDVTRSALLPQIVGFGEANYTDSDGPSQDVSYETLAYGVRLTQPLFRAEEWFRYDASQFQTEAARAEYNLAQQQLILDVASGYFGVLRAADNLTVARSAEAAFQRQYEQAQERFDVGLIAITEVYEARATYDASKSQRIAAESELAIAREQLARLTGDYDEELENLRRNFPLSQPQPTDPAVWAETALDQNWQIRSALFELNATEANLRTAKSGHLPTLDLNASYGKTDISGLEQAATLQSQRDGTTTEAQIGITLNVPLYMGGGTQAGVRQQRSLVIAAEQSLETIRRDIRVNTRSLYSNVNTNIQSASALSQTIVSRRSALNATRAGYEVGTRNIVEVLDAQRNYFVALRDFANARYDYIVNSLQLKQASGTLSPEDLVQLNNWLSAEAPGIQALADEDDTLDNPVQ
ncbi:TolC family outer membrane protein [Marinobacter halotolerans]|uniref:TolC family outer membrane protein n=1 Tax=Marinobacter halotolerans TaxID=1569211 RepID=UPI001244E094|nr:TolC family outer membrane protein [Marinobacter halotolerans]